MSENPNQPDTSSAASWRRVVVVVLQLAVLFGLAISIIWFTEPPPQEPDLSPQQPSGPLVTLPHRADLALGQANDGTVYRVSLTPPPQRYCVVIKASGTPCPHDAPSRWDDPKAAEFMRLALRVNGEEKAAWYLDSQSTTEYVSPVLRLESGPQDIALELENDFAAAACDRNARIESFSLVPVGPAPTEKSNSNAHTE